MAGNAKKRFRLVEAKVTSPFKTKNDWGTFEVLEKSSDRTGVAFGSAGTDEGMTTHPKNKIEARQSKNRVCMAQV